MNEDVGLAAIFGGIVVASAFPLTAKPALILGGFLVVVLLTSSYQTGALHDFGQALGGSFSG